MRLARHREVKETKIEIIPMIDTMFFLLVFFILASLNILDLRGLNLELPASADQTRPRIDPKDVRLEIRIDKDGNKTIVPGDVVVKVGTPATADLVKSVRNQLGTEPNEKQMAAITITIAPDEETAHESVIGAIDDARGAKIGKFNIR